MLPILRKEAEPLIIRRKCGSGTREIKLRELLLQYIFPNNIGILLGKLGQRGGNGLLLIQDGVVRNELKDLAGRLDISDSVRAKIKNY